MPETQKSDHDVHFLFSFGLHASREDFLKAKAVADRFKPHLYAGEEPYLLRSTRAEASIRINRYIEMARRDPYARQTLLNARTDFGREQMAYIVDVVPGPLIYYPLEAHDTTDAIREKERADEMGRRAIRLAHEGDMRGAIKAELAAKEIMEASNRSRDSDIVQNLGTYAEEARSLFPQLRRFDQLRVFIRLGHGHTRAFIDATHAYAGDGKITIGRVMDDHPIHRFNPSEYIMRAYAFGKPVDDLWAVGSILGSVLFTANIHSHGGRIDHAELIEDLEALRSGGPSRAIRALTGADRDLELREWLADAAKRFKTPDAEAA